MAAVNMHGERSGWYDYNAGASVTVNHICAQWVDNKVRPQLLQKHAPNKKTKTVVAATAFVAGPFTKSVGVVAFAKQFQKKTGNKWEDRATFVSEYTHARRPKIIL